MGRKTIISYSSNKRRMSLLEAARAIKAALTGNEQIGEFEYEPDERRKIFREEVLHHTPAVGEETKITGIILTDNDGKPERSAISIKHYGLKPSQEIASALAPKKDKRFKQELSSEDIKIAARNAERLH